MGWFLRAPEEHPSRWREDEDAAAGARGERGIPGAGVTVGSVAAATHVDLCQSIAGRWLATACPPPPQPPRLGPFGPSSRERARPSGSASVLFEERTAPTPTTVQTRALQVSADRVAATRAAACCRSRGHGDTRRGRIRNAVRGITGPRLVELTSRY
jgi:hypothetical protein